jgi:3-oxoacyl-[acyl-carrier protein] reductase
MTDDDRTVLITGASRGLGRVLAYAFGSGGDFVAVGYRTHEQDARAVVEELRTAGGDGMAVGLDLRDAATLGAAVRAVEDRRGGIDVLVNNAAVTHHAVFALDQAAAWEEVIATNLVGVAACTRAVVRGMLGRRAGAIINVASIAALRALQGHSSYAAAKAGVLGLTRTLAMELAPRGIRVNAVVPGLLDLGMAERVPRAMRQQLRDRIPLGREGTGDEVAAAALFLASSAARYIVGQALVVDGGMSL